MKHKNLDDHVQTLASSVSNDFRHLQLYTWTQLVTKDMGLTNF